MDSRSGISTNSSDLLFVGDQECDIESLMLEKKGKKSQLTGQRPLKTYRLPQSSVLSQVKNFLPKIELANKELEEKLQQVPASDVDIENTDNDSEVIEMNLALVQQDTDTDSSGESDSDSSEDFEQEVTVDNFKISNKKTSKVKPSIVELSSSSDDKQDNCDDKT